MLSKIHKYLLCRDCYLVRLKTLLTLYPIRVYLLTRPEAILEVTIEKNRIKNKRVTKVVSNTSPAHDHSGELNRLSRIKGQVEGVERMILEKRYCPDIVTQIKAIRSALRSLEANIVEGHLGHCVRAAMNSRDPKIVQKKLEEILFLMKGQG